MQTYEMTVIKTQSEITAVFRLVVHRRPLPNCACALDWRPLACFSTRSANSLAVSAVVGQAVVTPYILNALFELQKDLALLKMY